MKTMVRATLIALSLVLAMSATALAGTTRIPFTSTTTMTGVPDPGSERFAGNSWHVNEMVLVYDQVSDNLMVAGTVTVTVSFLFGGGQGNAMWGTELIEPTAYPGEGFTCTMSGGWDTDGVMQANDRCTGFGPHLEGWMYRSHITGETEVEGYLVRPGE